MNKGCWRFVGKTPGGEDTTSDPEDCRRGAGGGRAHQGTEGAPPHQGRSGEGQHEAWLSLARAKEFR